MKQKEVSVLDFNAIDWDMVNQEKAAFIHTEILQYNKELIDHMNIVTSKGACQENCVNGYVRISRLEPVCQIVWQIDLLLKPNF